MLVADGYSRETDGSLRLEETFDDNVSSSHTVTTYTFANYTQVDDRLSITLDRAPVEQVSSSFQETQTQFTYQRLVPGTSTFVPFASAIRPPQRRRGSPVLLSAASIRCSVSARLDGGDKRWRPGHASAHRSVRAAHARIQSLHHAADDRRGRRYAYTLEGRSTIR
jgi:hypothetical protein